MHSERYMLATALFDACSLNEHLTTVLHSSYRVAVYYVTPTRDQGSLGRGYAIAAYMKFPCISLLAFV